MKALIFDVDGTLADTEDAHRLAFNDAFAKAGYDWTWDQVRYKALLAVTGGKQRIRFFLESHDPEMLERDDIDDLIVGFTSNPSGNITSLDLYDMTLVDIDVIINNLVGYFPELLPVKEQL